MPEEIAMNIWLLVFSVFCMFYAVVNLKYLRTFWEHRHEQYISQRRPIVLVLYCVLASVYLFILIPCMSASIYIIPYRHDLTESSALALDAFYFVMDSIYGTVFPTFINLIAIRVWLLFYDHKFAMATVDRIWRKSINPSEKNFFLNNKITAGNHKFLFRAVFAFWVCKITILMTMILVFIRPFDDRTKKSDELVYYTFRICIIVPTLIFILWIYKKVHHVHDEFNIKLEMRYLAFFVAFLIIASFATLIVIIFTDIPIYRFELFVYANDAFFYCGTCYMQTRWVLTTYQSKQDDVRNQRQKNSKRELGFSMVDVLRNKHSFEAFVRHCMAELSVESLLFLVEVAQYKATLASYNVPDRTTEFQSLHVQTVNTRQIVLDAMNDQMVVPLKDDAKPVQTALDNLNLGAFLPDEQEQDEQVTSPTATPISERNRTNKKYGGTFSQFRQFQQSILERKWLPIASSLKLQQQNISSIGQALLTDKSSESAKSKTADSVQLPAVGVPMAVIDGKEVDMNKVLSLSPDAHQETGGAEHGHEEPQRSIAMISMERNTSTLALTEEARGNGRCMVSHQWIREYGWFLYEKYAKEDSDLAINVSGEVREFLINFFTLPEEAVSTYIVEHSGGEEDESKELPAGVDEQLLINTYLYHLFDHSFEEVWSLLQSDSFIRFTMTPAYQILGEAAKEEAMQIVYDEPSETEKP